MGLVQRLARYAGYTFTNLKQTLSWMEHRLIILMLLLIFGSISAGIKPTARGQTTGSIDTSAELLQT